MPLRSHSTQDHPRTRGEKIMIRFEYSRYSGSPPHTRGEGKEIFKPSTVLRITPAHAGRSDFISDRCDRVQDHPPHTRGEGVVAVLLRLAVGITPAHAGRRKAGRRKESGFQDHPRTRGEKNIFCEPKFTLTGSPPHTRGEEGLAHPLWHDCRITPAHAGRSFRLSACKRPDGDHPRTRGEKCRHFHTACRCVGSPPHTRGEGECAEKEFCTIRITPAHAGRRK